MSHSPRILYCHCANSQALPGAVKNGVLAGLRNSGAAFEEVADLCDLAARRDPKLQEIAQAGEIRIAACYPRAVKWLFAAGGAPLPAATKILNMRTVTAGEVLGGLLGTAASPAPKPSQDEVAVSGEPATNHWKPWFPVIDYDRCTQCNQCMGFCLFDVYGRSPGGKVQVEKPANCKTDCPACARVCPEMAILFPKHKSGVIAGEEPRPEDMRREAVKVDISALLGGDIHASLRNRSGMARVRFSKDRDEVEALNERRAYLEKLQKEMDIPPEVLESMPTIEQLRARSRRPRG